MPHMQLAHFLRYAGLQRCVYRTLGEGVSVEERKAHVGIILKVAVCEGALTKHLLGEGALDVHYQLEHLVVGLAVEEDLASEELIDDAANAPDVHGVVCKVISFLIC